MVNEHVRSIELDSRFSRLGELALIEDTGEVWLVLPLRWWDLATLIWWLFVPADRKGTVRMTLSTGRTVRVTAVRVALQTARVRCFKH
jgi:hypothetical protein